MTPRFAATHGDHGTRLYRIWTAMKGRCQNPHDRSYAHYGDRGITVCAEWQNYESFRDWALANGYSQGLEIDRVNNDGNYEPSNCRWATRSEQLHNYSQNHWLTAFGETKIATDWINDSRCLISFPALLRRLSAGWDVEQALTTPPWQRRKDNS